MERIEQVIAKLVNETGGKTYYVGGFVRDLLLGIENKDVDIEVHGISNSKLLEILNKVGKPLSYGKSFGIYSLEGEDIDIAMPRIEKNTGDGHKDFDVYVNPYIDLNSAIKRRDFTINAIYKDVLTGELIDPFNGQKDLKNKVIRHIDSDTFVEDPLRVLRGAQFASRFEFDIAEETMKLCKGIDIKTLSKQRVEEELKKALLKSNKPSIFFKCLQDMNQLSYWFNDVNTKYIDKANKYIENINNKYAYLLSSLCIDSSFDVSTITNEKEIIEYVDSMKNNIHQSFNNDYEINNLFFNLKDINDYIYLRITINESDNYLFDSYEKYKVLINKPYVMGKDLIELGYEPSIYFNEALKYATTLRLKGTDKNEALKLVDEYIKKISSNN